MFQKKPALQLASIRFDHTTEFENAKFFESRNVRGLDHNFYAPRTLQQNGVVKRNNMSLKDMERTINL